MRPHEEIRRIDGPAGTIELLVDAPASPRGIAIVAHPHPLYGGAASNKVAQTLARSFAQLDYLALRPNFRGVGDSAGTHDNGLGETDDLLAVIADAEARHGALPVALAGFSFGAYVQTRVARRLQEAGHAAQGLVLVGLATGTIAGDRHYEAERVPRDSLLIHGANDDTVPLVNVLAWAEPQRLPVTVIPGADHFFHGQLQTIRDIVLRGWRH
ncbi:thioesterase domain-containing protein [uncultured Propionivibrio sp.]|uniref:alpha/beta hydrolase n=1 Tax=uncultured Propionivibrio sp. TaxID=426737 RepID=UPI0029BFE7D2|nr:thioesterase domain-containing protein [uncultured Propionivibrio sp.]